MSGGIKFGKTPPTVFTGNLAIVGVACNQVLYTVAVTVLFPGSILALAAGAVFGLVLGSLLVWLGTVLGQTLAFIIGRSALLCRSAAAVSITKYSNIQRMLLLLLQTCNTGTTCSFVQTDFKLFEFRGLLDSAGAFLFLCCSHDDMTQHSFISDSPCGWVNLFTSNPFAACMSNGIQHYMHSEVT